MRLCALATTIPTAGDPQDLMLSYHVLVAAGEVVAALDSAHGAPCVAHP